MERQRIAQMKLLRKLLKHQALNQKKRLSLWSK